MDIKDTKWIDNASYEQLVEKLRNAPIGHRFFVAGTNIQLYFDDAYKTAHNAATSGERVRVSKSIGWK